jgi:hypothetical protein
MKSKIGTNIFLLILVALFSASGANAAGIGKNIVVLLAGEGLADGSGNQFTQLGLVVPEGVLCFDLDLVDAKTGNVIGSGSDCLSDIDGRDNGGMSLTATSFFHFPGGTLVSQGLVTVQPKLHGLEKFTHVTGAAPSASENNVIYGDGKFKDAEGSVRLSGLVNLSRLGTGYIDFDCVFIIDLWHKRHRWHKRHNR